MDETLKNLAVDDEFKQALDVLLDRNYSVMKNSTSDITSEMLQIILDVMKANQLHDMRSSVKLVRETMGI